MAQIDFGDTTVREFLQSILDNGEQLAVASELRKKYNDGDDVDMKEMVRHTETLIRNFCATDPDNYYAGSIVLGEDYFDDEEPDTPFSISFCDATELEYFMSKKQQESVKTIETLPKTKAVSYYEGVQDQFFDLVPSCDSLLVFNGNWGAIADMVILIESVERFGRIPFAAQLLWVLAPNGEETYERHAFFSSFDPDDGEYYDEDDEALRELFAAERCQTISNFFTSSENSGIYSFSPSEISDRIELLEEAQGSDDLLREIEEDQNLTEEEKRKCAYNETVSLILFYDQIQSLAKSLSETNDH